eukprot:803357-Alexandrium_andersonii.AAC.1
MLPSVLKVSSGPQLQPEGANRPYPRVAPLALGPAEWGPPTFVDSEPRRGLFGQSGVLGPRPPQAGFWAPTSL